MAYFGNASRQLLKNLQGVRRTHPDLRKGRVSHKDYVWFPWQQQIGRFLLGFYLVHAKIIHFAFVLSILQRMWP